MRRRSIGRVSLLVVGLFVAPPACGDLDSDTTGLARIGSGRIGIALMSVSDEGRVYRLSANLVISGRNDHLEIESSDDADAEYRNVNPGVYSVEMLPGWTLLRREGDGSETPVEARLDSPNPHWISVHAERLTLVVLLFTVNGDGITMAPGTVGIHVHVSEEDEGVVDSDGDGVPDVEDIDPLDPFSCSDWDADTCDDCTSGWFDPMNDGPDMDWDGICDPADLCTDFDGDGVGNGLNENAGCVIGEVDVDDSNPHICADVDFDTCDDCTSGSFHPMSDGSDTDGDGVCDAVEGSECVDVDGDGVGDGTAGNQGCVVPDVDGDDTNPFVCTDVDGDTCDDCASGWFDPMNDGPDIDGDGICDFVDEFCGNDVIEGTEVCDGNDLGGMSCVDVGYDGGLLACNATCNGLDVTQCALCGNNTLEPPEVCDGADLDGITCATLGYDDGTLFCDALCSAFDTSQCTVCGDGLAQSGESCDGTDLNGETCDSVIPGSSGTLACYGDCTFDTRDCQL